MGATESTTGIRLIESPYGKTKVTPSSERLDQIIQLYTRYSQYPDTGELGRLLDDVTDDEKMRLLKRHEPLRRAAQRSHSEMISTILSSLSPHQRLEVLSVGDQFGWTSLHRAAFYGTTDSVEMILSQLTSEQQLTLLTMRTVFGHTPADYATLFGKKETERLLRDYEQRANQQTEVIARHENPPVTREDLACILDRIKKLEDQKRVQQNNSAAGCYHGQIIIKDDSTGFSYQRVMSRCLMEKSERVEVDDPYIRNHYQILNFLRLCELLVKSDCGVRYIKLKTGQDKHEVRQQKDKLHEIAQSLASHKVKLDVAYSDSLHDREIRLSSGWVIKIGRGLDYFKPPPPSELELGTFNFDLRQCRETTVDIFYKTL